MVCIIIIQSYQNGYIIAIVLGKYSWRPLFEDKNARKKWATSFPDRTGMYGNVRSDGSKQTRDDKESLATINLAVEEGINFFDTATALLIP